MQLTELCMWVCDVHQKVDPVRFVRLRGALVTFEQCDLRCLHLKLHLMVGVEALREAKTAIHFQSRRWRAFWACKLERDLTNVFFWC